MHNCCPQVLTWCTAVIGVVLARTNAVVSLSAGTSRASTATPANSARRANDAPEVAGRVFTGAVLGVTVEGANVAATVRDVPAHRSGRTAPA